MLVSPFTVIAQIINFLILVALLKRFLYKPIITAMEKREREIVRRLEEAALQIEDAKAKAQLYRQKQQELEEQKESWLAEAKDEVDREKQQLKQQARIEVNEERSKWYQALQREKTNFLQDLRHKIGQQITATTRKILADLANTDLEEQIVSTFIDRLNNLEDSDLKAIQTALRSNLKPAVTIRSGFPISPEKSDRLLNILQKQSAEEVEASVKQLKSVIH